MNLSTSSKDSCEGNQCCYLCFSYQVCYQEHIIKALKKFCVRKEGVAEKCRINKKRGSRRWRRDWTVNHNYKTVSYNLAYLNVTLASVLIGGRMSL